MFSQLVVFSLRRHIKVVTNIHCQLLQIFIRFHGCVCWHNPWLACTHLRCGQHVASLLRVASVNWSHPETLIFCSSEQFSHTTCTPLSVSCYTVEYRSNVL